MDSLAYVLNDTKTCIYGLFREICFLGPRNAFSVQSLISKGQNVMERPSERDTHVDGTLGGGDNARQGHQEGGLLVMPWGWALSDLSPEDLEK